jgi:hypothetical protein
MLCRCLCFPSGAYLWTLKDKIDRQWMRGYQVLPSMEEMQENKKKKELKERAETEKRLASLPPLQVRVFGC